MKRFIARAIEIIAYYFCIDSIFYLLNRKAKRTLCFHNVLPDGLKIDGEAGAFDEAESHFRYIVREVGRKFGFSTDVFDPKMATITFDDGYLNQYEIAARVLEEEGHVPAILFVAGDNLDNSDPSKCLVTDALTHWVTFTPTIKADASERMRIWREEIRVKYAADISHRGRAVLAEYDKIYPIANVMNMLSSEYRRLRLTGVTTSNVMELRKRGWLVGWHTRSHFPLMQLSREEQQKELTPMELFEGDLLAYPYGCPGSIDKETAECAKDSGAPCALSAVNDVPGWNGRFLLPRMYVGGDKYSIHFELSGAKHFMKHGRLLPAGYGFVKESAHK